MRRGSDGKVLEDCRLEGGWKTESMAGRRRVMEERSWRLAYLRGWSGEKRRQGGREGVLGVEEAGSRKEGGGCGETNRTNTSDYNRTPQQDEI